MTFVSFEFGVLLTLTFTLFWSLPHKGRAPLLLAASYIFYAYWNPWYAGLIFLSTGIDFLAAHYISLQKSESRRRWILWTCVAANLTLLGYFKYTNFGLSALRAILGESGAFLPSALDILLPVGISFYTFQSMAYTIDVYHGRIKPEPSFAAFALFVSYFPQLVAGPIERASDLLPQLQRRAVWNEPMFEEGLRLLLWGFAKKLVIADRLGAVFFPVFQNPAAHGAPDLIVASLGLFTMLYFDFSSYTDMARGTSCLFGVRLSENFRFPMTATSIAEFWRRWHITLSNWVRDYVFIPLGGLRARNPWLRFRTIMITMGLIGLWHGANWTFVIWGLSNGLLLALHLAVQTRFQARLKKSRWWNSPPAAFMGWAFTMGCHAFSVIWFFSPNIASALNHLDRIATFSAWQQALDPVTTSGGLLLVALWIVHALGERFSILESLGRLAAPARAAGYLLIFAAIVGLGTARSATFVYFQF
jgi:alginate O-acetyltransferase complex protein AlgI